MDILIYLIPAALLLGLLGLGGFLWALRSGQFDDPEGAVHKIVRRPVCRGDAIVPRDIMYLSISLDHRIVDGAVGAYFMNDVVRRLENPGLLLLDMA